MTTRKERPILFAGPMVRAILDGRKTVTRRVVDPLMFIETTNPDSIVEQSSPDFGAAAAQWAPCPYGQPGDRLWVRETFGLTLSHDDEGRPTEARKVLDGDGRQCFILYRADGDVEWSDGDGYTGPSCWKPSIHMPRWASRLTLEVASVRVERLHDITEEDAVLEGCVPYLHESWSAWDPETQGYPEFTVEPDAEMVERRRLENVRHHKPKVIATARDQFRTLWTTINGAESWGANPWVWRVEFRRVETA